MMKAQLTTDKGQEKTMQQGASFEQAEDSSQHKGQSKFFQSKGSQEKNQQQEKPIFWPKFLVKNR